jgi:glycosyltransferase involved in cell wall biosynthesis
MARELAVQKSNGEYVAFLDCDDFWHHSKLSMQMPLFFRHEEVGVVYSNYWIVNSERKKIFSKRKLPIGDILDDLLGSDSVGFLTAIIKRRVFDKFLPFFNTRYNIIHDFDLMIRISIEWKFSCVQSPLASYRYHGENETIVKSFQYTRELEEWIDKNKSNSKISNQRNFYRRQVVLMYLRGIESIQNKEVKRAICFLYKMPLCWEKMKLLVFILLPNSILRSIRSKP